MFTREILRCPVGREFLGSRHINEAAALDCKDCDFTYVWEPFNTVPLSRKIDHVDHSCGCGMCDK